MVSKILMRLERIMDEFSENFKKRENIKISEIISEIISERAEIKNTLEMK